jgi:hypothetical protein
MAPQKDIFSDILSMEEVEGLLLLSFDGDLLFHSTPFPSEEKLKGRAWNPLAKSLSGIREADLVYAEKRLYVRRSNAGYLVVIMRPFTTSAMVRLSCDLILPSLKAMRKARSFGAQVGEYKL